MDQRYSKTDLNLFCNQHPQLIINSYAELAGGLLSLIQKKLTVNEPSDIYEQEADRVEDQVMRMSTPMSHVFSSYPRPGLQRKCAALASGQGQTLRFTETGNPVFYNKPQRMCNKKEGTADTRK